MSTHNEQIGDKDKNDNMTVETNSINNAIRVLHEQGLTITESMKVLISEYGMSLREAKKSVSAHSVWKAVTEAAEPLHDVLIKIWKNAEKKRFY